MNTNCKFIIDIDVLDVEKRFEPSKYYVYCLLVTWSDSNRYKIYRRYSQFYDFQCNLEDEFNKEAGEYDPKDRILPILPSKIYLGRSQIFSVAIERKHQINKYCKKLIQLPDQISCSKLVNNFFSVNQDDLSLLIRNDSKLDLNKISQPIESKKYICVHDFKAKSKSELSVSKDQIVEVHMKNLHGWWFVSHSYGQGYVPKLVLLPLNDEDFIEDQKCFRQEKNSLFIITNDFKARNEDELSIKKGEYIKVLEKRFNGWWTVHYDGKTGLAPAVCICELALNTQDFNMIFTIDSNSSLSSINSLTSTLTSISSAGSILSADSIDGSVPTRHSIISVKPARPPKPVITQQILNVTDLIETRF